LALCHRCGIIKSPMQERVKVKTIFSQDGPMPILPGFHALEQMRKVELKEYFPGTAGLLAQGESKSTSLALLAF
jgi:hypothetical protein